MYRTIYRFLLVFGMALIGVGLFRLIFFDETPTPFVMGMGLGGGFLFYLERFVITIIEERIYGG